MINTIIIFSSDIEVNEEQLSQSLPVLEFHAHLLVLAMLSLFYSPASRYANKIQ